MLNSIGLAPGLTTFVEICGRTFNHKVHHYQRHNAQMHKIVGHKIALLCQKYVQDFGPFSGQKSGPSVRSPRLSIYLLRLDSLQGYFRQD